MGRDILLFDDDYIKPSEDLSSPLIVQQLLRQTRSLSPSDLRLYFESLFQRMSNSSKEAVIELLWTGLSASEQQAFEMPYFGHRWSETSIYNALRDAFDIIEPTTTMVRTRVGRSIRLGDSGTAHFSAGIGSTRTTDVEVQALEEQFFNILRDAISRAERPEPVRAVRTSSTGVNTHNTDDHHSPRRNPM